MRLTQKQIESELKSILLVSPDHDKWLMTSLLDLPIVEQQARVIATFELRYSERNVALATCLLQSFNQLVPADPEAPDDTWKMVIGAEVHFMGHIRAFVANTLPNRMPDRTIWLAIAREQVSYSQPEFSRMKADTLKKVIRNALTAGWLWKTGRDPFVFRGNDDDTALWIKSVHNFCKEGFWTKDVVYDQRTKTRKAMARFLFEHQDGLAETGIGPLRIEPAGQVAEQSIAPKPAVVQVDSSAATVEAEPVTAPPGTMTTTPVQTATPNYLELYLDTLPQPQFLPPEWNSIIETAVDTPGIVIQGNVDVGKTALMKTIAHAARKAESAPLLVNVSDFAPFAATMDVFQFVAQHGSFARLYPAPEDRQGLINELARCEREGRLLVLADNVDDVMESERPNVAARLSGFRGLSSQSARRFCHLDRRPPPLSRCQRCLTIHSSSTPKQ